MSGMIEPIARMVNQLSKLPGVGQKTAQRLAYYIISLPEEQVRELAVAIFNGKKQVRFCSVCGNYATEDPCPMCRDEDRKNGQLCVVKDPRDVAAMERMRDYTGQYHVLHGVISPMDGITPEHLKIKELLARIDGGVKEVIVATNPSVEGEATGLYIARLMKPFGVKVTRLAYGLPVGATLEYADSVTLSKAFEGRTEV